MHTYSIDKDLRTKVAVVIFAMSMMISLILQETCAEKLTVLANVLRSSGLKKIIELVEWLEVSPDFLGIPFWYGVLSLFYNCLLWKIWPFRNLHGIPDISGKWEGTLTSTFDDKSIPMEMNVKQNWNKISLQCHFPKTNSMSNSNTAAILVDSTKGIEIYFGYVNDSYAVDKKLQTHYGYNILNLVDSNHIKARYFNDRNNPQIGCKGGNKGSFEIKRIRKN